MDNCKNERVQFYIIKMLVMFYNEIIADFSNRQLYLCWTFCTANAQSLSILNCITYLTYGNKDPKDKIYISIDNVQSLFRYCISTVSLSLRLIDWTYKWYGWIVKFEILNTSALWTKRKKSLYNGPNWWILRASCLKKMLKNIRIYKDFVQVHWNPRVKDLQSTTRPGFSCPCTKS